MLIPSPQWMLAAGIFLSFILGRNESVQKYAKQWGTKLLQLSVILLGSALNFNTVIKQGTEGVLITLVSILSIFFLGHWGERFLKIDKNQSLLITMGTAICGGSAIGALAPVINADALAITISMGIVFLLNALAVFIFPFIGGLLDLTQDQFGLWSALAIHDTSSVVAASSLYGNRALEVATTIKLTRALWIIPITLFFGLKLNKSTKNKISIPWFIAGFLALSVAFTFLDNLSPLKPYFLLGSKTGFALTLFLIGLTFSPERIKKVGLRPFLFGVGLWSIVVVLSLIFVKI